MLFLEGKHMRNYCFISRLLELNRLCNVSDMMIDDDNDNDWKQNGEMSLTGETKILEQNLLYSSFVYIISHKICRGSNPDLSSEKHSPEQLSHG